MSYIYVYLYLFSGWPLAVGKLNKIKINPQCIF